MLLSLIYKELKIELRQKYAINAIFIYLISTIFICYLSLNNILDAHIWNGLFWIIIVFISINTSSKSFLNETKESYLYLYTLVSPQKLILAKLIYNVFLIFIMSVLSYFFYSVFLGDLIKNKLLFLLIVLIGSVGITAVLTLTSAIASKTNGNFSIMAILSMPLLIPILLLIIKLSKLVIMGYDMAYIAKYFFMLGIVNALVFILSYLLFPYLWKD